MNRSLLVKQLYPLAMFCTLGTINAVLYFSVFAFFWKYLHINYLLAVSLSYVLSAAFQFFSNRKMTFKASGTIYPQIVKYFILLGINYLITVFIVHAVVTIFELSPFIGLLLSTFSSGLTSFILFKFWVFRQTSIAL